MTIDLTPVENARDRVEKRMEEMRRDSLRGHLPQALRTQIRRLEKDYQRLEALLRADRENGTTLN